MSDFTILIFAFLNSTIPPATIDLTHTTSSFRWSSSSVTSASSSWSRSLSRWSSSLQTFDMLCANVFLRLTQGVSHFLCLQQHCQQFDLTFIHHNTWNLFCKIEIFDTSCILLWSRFQLIAIYTLDLIFSDGPIKENIKSGEPSKYLLARHRIGQSFNYTKRIGRPRRRTSILRHNTGWGHIYVLVNHSWY